MILYSRCVTLSVSSCIDLYVKQNTSAKKRLKDNQSKRKEYMYVCLDGTCLFLVWKNCRFLEVWWQFRGIAEYDQCLQKNTRLAKLMVDNWSIWSKRFSSHLVVKGLYKLLAIIDVLVTPAEYARIDTMTADDSSVIEAKITKLSMCWHHILLKRTPSRPCPSMALPLCTAPSK